MREVAYISYNTGTRALPDIYALALGRCAPSGIVHIYQATHSCLCYNLYIFFLIVIITGAIAVSKLLMGNCTLQVFDVSSNNIGDDGISVIVEQLQNITTLTKLVVTKCGLSVKGSFHSATPDSEDYITISLAVRPFSLFLRTFISGHTGHII